MIRWFCLALFLTAPAFAAGAQERRPSHCIAIADAAINDRDIAALCAINIGIITRSAVKRIIACTSVQIIVAVAALQRAYW